MGRLPPVAVYLGQRTSPSVILETHRGAALPSRRLVTSLPSPNVLRLESEVTALRHLVAQQGDQLASLQQKLRKSDRPSRPIDACDVEREVTDTADTSDMSNLYSYAVVMALESSSPTEVCCSVFYVTLLLFFQVIIAYGFWDGALIASALSTFPAYSDPLHYSMYYAFSVLPGTYTPLLHAIASVSALVMLALTAKGDTEGTLLTPCPAASCSWSPHTSGLRRLLRVLLCIFLQFVWSLRSLFVPVCAGIGTAGVFIQSTNLVDIVLNSMAISFVFELDEFLYHTLVPARQRQAFQRRPQHQPTSPLSRPNNRGGGQTVGACVLVDRYCWLVFLLDACFTSIYYLRMIHLRTSSDSSMTRIHYGLNRWYMAARLLILGIASVHLALVRESGYSQPGTCLRLISVHVALLSFAAAWTLPFVASLDFAFSGTLSPLMAETTNQISSDGSAWDCIFSDDPEYCHVYHLIPGAHRAMGHLDDRETDPATWFVERLQIFLGIQDGIADDYSSGSSADLDDRLG